MDMGMSLNVKQILQVHDNDTNKDHFLIEKGGKWVEITKEEYNQFFRGEQ